MKTTVFVMLAMVATLLTSGCESEADKSARAAAEWQKNARDHIEKNPPQYGSGPQLYKHGSKKTNEEGDKK